MVTSSGNAGHRISLSTASESYMSKFWKSNKVADAEKLEERLSIFWLNLSADY